MYFSDVPTATLPKIKDAIAVALYYDLFGNHYNLFGDFFLTGYADACIPEVLTLVPNPDDHTGGVCGCCVDYVFGYLYPCT